MLRAQLQFVAGTERILTPRRRGRGGAQVHSEANELSRCADIVSQINILQTKLKLQRLKSGTSLLVMTIYKFTDDSGFSHFS